MGNNEKTLAKNFCQSVPKQSREGEIEKHKCKAFRVPSKCNLINIISFYSDDDDHDDNDNDNDDKLLL